MDRKKEKDRQGIMIAAGAALVALFIIGAYVYLTATTPRYEQTSLCPKERTYAQSIVLVDQTDSMSAIQKRTLLQVLENARDSLDTFERLTIYVLNEENFEDPGPVFDLCNPGTGEDASFIYQNPTKIQKVWDERFGEPLRLALDRLLVDRTADTSPILEMMQSVTNLAHLHGMGGPVRLYVVSDLLQNVPEFSHYGAATDLESFLLSDYFATVRGPMNSVDVYAYYVMRPNHRHLQGNDHVEFWSAVLQAQGARLVEVVKVY
jgi:hypothetical protein